jgi:ribonuclease HI
MTEPMFPEPPGASEDTGAADRPSAGSSRLGFLIRTDGAARGNPGPASLGAALNDLRRPDASDPRAAPDASISDNLGIQTNNVAEDTGTVRALELASQLGASVVNLLIDS